MLGTCKFALSKLSKTESLGVANIETDVQRYSQTGSRVQGAQHKRPRNVTRLDLSNTRRKHCKQRTNNNCALAMAIHDLELTIMAELFYYKFLTFLNREDRS